MTHVATAVLQVSGVKKTAPVVATNRATELRLQKVRTNNIVNSSNSTYVTWRINSRHNVPIEQPKNIPHKKSATTVQTKEIKGNIKSRIELFETNKENQNEINANKTANRHETHWQKALNQAKKQDVAILNGESEVNKGNVERIKKSQNILENSKNNENDTVVIVKEVLAKWQGTQSKKLEAQEVKKYRTVDVPIRPAAINIAVRPWTSSGQVVTVSDENEVQRILADRRKLVDESIENSEKSIQELGESVELRSLSLESYDESQRESSGASLDVNFPKALDLARHQQRPLWKDIKGVQEAGLVEKLPKEARIRQEAKFELMLSEGSFLHNLHVLKSHYMNNIHKHIPQVVSEKDYDLLFKHALDVQACSEAFLKDLDDVWQVDPMLDGVYEVVRKHATEHFGAYIRYCRNMLDMSNHLAELISGKEAFRNLLEVLINREGSQRLTLDAFLTSPMQRITKLPLLMKTILDKLEDGSMEHKQCIAAFEATAKIATECDEVVNEKKRLEELLRLSQEIEFADDTKSIPVVAPQRSLVSRANVKHFAFRDKAPKREKLQLILFSDLLLVTKRKSDKLFIVVDHCSRDYLQLKEMDNPTLYGEGESTKQLKPVVITMLANSQDKKLDLVVTFKDQNQNKEWLQMFVKDEPEDDIVQVIAFQEHKTSNTEELSFSPGDVIQITAAEVEGWCEGELISDGTKGRFPINKTSKITSARVKASNLKAKREVRSSNNLEELPNKVNDEVAKEKDQQNDELSSADNNTQESKIQPENDKESI